MKTGTMKTVEIKGTRYTIERVRGYFSRQSYYSMRKLSWFSPMQDEWLGYWDSIAEFRAYVKKNG